jgi:hypothetical protein
MKYKLPIIVLIAFLFSHSYGQTRTVGLFLNDSTKAFNGYTLFAPKQNTMTYLINNEGRICHEWTASKYPPGQSVYLLENGDLLRTCEVQGQLSTGGGEGGRIEEYNWNDSLVWQLDYSNDTCMQHHDVKRLPNGNTIMLVVEKKTVQEVIAAGFDTSNFQEPDFQQQKMMLPDMVVEIQPTPPIGGNVIWEWHVWDHLIQSNDSTKANYGVPSAHPEMIDVAGDHRELPVFWNHMNSIDYNPAFDQIALSVRGNSEVWVIDHSTTTAEAKGFTGGKSGRGGGLLYRWGNSITYGAGTVNDEKYFQQHDAEWINPGCPGAGDILCFNNGVGRNYSTVDEIIPPVDSSGNYMLIFGSAFGPSSLTWTYEANPPSSLYGNDICGAQRLPNGNTLINYGTLGIFFEVTSNGQMVWKYINPVDASGPVTQGDSLPSDPTHPGEQMNSVFRVYRYPPGYSAFTGKDLTPGNFIEQYAVTSVKNNNKLSVSFKLLQNYPNPFNPSTVIEYSLPNVSQVRIDIYNEIGQIVATPVNSTQKSGNHSINWNASGMASGVYFYSMKATDISGKQFFNVKKMLILK